MIPDAAVIATIFILLAAIAVCEFCTRILS